MQVCSVLGLLALVVAAAALRHHPNLMQQQQQQQHMQQQQQKQHHSGNRPTGPKIADKDFLVRQKAILQLLVRIQQPNLYTELADLGKKYDIFSAGSRYRNAPAYDHFVERYQMGVLPRGEIFNLYNDDYLDQAIALFDVLYFAKDYDTFISTAAWARDRYNEGQFAYALYVAVIHREDLQGIVLPPLYEVYPYFYFYGYDIQKFAQAKQQGLLEYSIYANFSGYNYGNYYGSYYGNLEQLLSYFTEDIGLNAYNAYSHIYNPFWFSSEKYGVNIAYRGEYYYYYYQQIVNLYNLNRMANNLPELEQFSWDKPIPYGYYPSLQYHNGKYFSARPDYYPLQNIRSYTINDIQTIEYRIREAIDSGYVYSKDGTRIPIFSYLKGINLLGNIIESNADSVNQRYYGSYQSMLRSLFSLIIDPGYSHGVAPGVMANFETALRDPAFYYFYSYINRFFRQYAYNQPAYTSADLGYSGVSIKNIDIGNLYTYFDYFNVDVSNAIYVAHPEEANKLNYVAKSLRLNHEPFTYKITVNSDKNASALVRVFLGPSYQAYYSSQYGFYGGGNEYYYEGYPQQQQQQQESEDFYKYINFDKMKEYFFELDRFPVNLVSGQNVIPRSSQQLTSTVGDILPFQQLYQQVDDALQGRGSYYIPEYDQQCGFPNRLVLPLGRPGGVPYTFFAMITPYSQSQKDVDADYQYSTCSGLYNEYDSRPLGYPFDRQINDFTQFYTPNMYLKDVYVFQKTQQQVKQPNYVKG